MPDPDESLGQYGFVSYQGVFVTTVVTPYAVEIKRPDDMSDEEWSDFCREFEEAYEQR